MDRGTEFIGVQASAIESQISLHSIAEESEMYSEAGEIQDQVANLQMKGDVAFRKKNYSEAMKSYDEILNMEEKNHQALSSRVLLHLQMKSFHSAESDVKKLLLFKPNYPEGHYLLGMTSFHLGKFDKALSSFLQALEFNKDPDQEMMLARNIASLLPKFTEVKDSLIKQILEMDPYRQLCEVGAILYEDTKYNTCIKVLGGARTFQTNQKGITMKVLLMLANSHSAMKRFDSAIAAYQECLTTALSAHDVHYQTKCLVSIASLYISLGEMHQGIIHYEQLLDLQSEIQAEDPDAPLPDLWTTELQCALHLNLTVAFRKIGDFQKAMKHAKALTELTRDVGNNDYMKNQSYLNVGIIHEVLGQYPEALKSYQTHLSHCKKINDTRESASTYGRLGSIYMELFNSTLSMTYHEQHLSLATSIGDDKLISEAHQLRGESFMKMDCFEDAVDCFMSMFRACPRSDLHTQTLALCKTAKAYKEMRKFQYSLYYCEQAKVIATDFSFSDIEVMCELNQACILKNSTQMQELDQAKDYLLKLIPKFEADIKKHQEEDTHCPKDLIRDLADCYGAMQTVLAKLSKKEDCLWYAEMHRSKVLTDLKTAERNGIPMADLTMNERKTITLEKMKDNVTELNATVIYYSVLEKMILIWVLQPDFGVTRFYSSKWTHTDESLQEHLEYLIGSLQYQGDVDLRYSGEHRALPHEDAKLDLIRNKNNNLLSDDDLTEVASEPSSTFVTYQSQAPSEKPPERQLFDLLIAPIDDLLCTLGDQSPLVIIPDDNLFSCPFAFLKDWEGRMMVDRFCLTVIPSMLAIEKVNQSAAKQMTIQHDLDMRRSQSRLGGMTKILSPALENYQMRTDESYELKHTNPRQTSNPRLLNAGDPHTPLQRSPTKIMPSRESTLFSLATTKSSVTLKLDDFSQTQQSLSMKDSLSRSTSFQRLMNLHNISTLTSCTATNTDITTSDFGVTDFAQVSSREQCVVLGNPYFPEKLELHGDSWKPTRSLTHAEEECKRVADILKTTAIIGKSATKEGFLQQAPKATVLHIATYTCLQKGYLAFSPNETDSQYKKIPESSYLVTASEISLLPLVAKLVVISGGWSAHDAYVENTLVLTSAFLAAGAQCVLMLLWPVPSATLSKFYHHFYMELRKGSLVTDAVKVASNSIMEDQRYSDMWYWAPYCIMGKDVHVDVGNIQRAMLDQTLDNAETTTPKDYLHPKLAFAPVPSKEDSLAKIQEILKCFLKRGIETDVSEDVLALVNLLDAALKRHHNSMLIKQSLELPDCLKDQQLAKDLLRVLEFKFQNDGNKKESITLLMPSVQEDNLLLAVMNALESVTEILKNKTCCRLFLDILPISQETISNIVDVLCITKHAKEVQLKTSDATVQPLWKNLKIKNFLATLGYHQVGTILNCDNVPSSRRILTACLQLLVSISTNKSLALLYNLDVKLLGHDSQHKMSSASMNTKKLPSLNPVMLPGSRMKMSTPWLSTVEEPDEMQEKIGLAKRMYDLRNQYKTDLRRTKKWHKQSVAPQAAASLAKIGRAHVKPEKVKVSDSEEITLDLHTINKHREHANSLLRERLDGVTQKYRDMSQKLYLPYVTN